MSNNKLPNNHNSYNSDLLQQIISGTDNFQIVADIFKQLSDCNRTRIFWLLCHCEECVVNISSYVNMSSPAVSHHLKQLKVAGLITSRRDGKEMYYKVAENKQSQLLHLFIEQEMQVACPETLIAEK